MSSSTLELLLRRLYRKLRLIRRTEEEIARIYPSDKIRSPVHLSIGQEAVAVGVCDALNPADAVSASYRCHAVYLAKGGSLPAMFAELYGRDTGCARGKGGSMHLVGMDQSILGASAVVGTTIPVAAGYALALQRGDSDRLVAAFFGDGAVEEGVFYETLNFAALHKLPILFVCENNGYAIHTPISKRWSTLRLAERVETFGISAHTIANCDVLAVREASAAACTSIRGGSGPVFLECRTYRWKEHVGPNEDYDAGYRDRSELAPWQEQDQVGVIGARLDPALKQSIDAEIEQELAAAIAFAESSPFPDASELETHVYA
jgi:pyruvate dehydrogenase E1 component alpha subunit